MSDIIFPVSGTNPSMVGGTGILVKFFPLLSSPPVIGTAARGANPLFGSPLQIIPVGGVPPPASTPSAQNASGMIAIPIGQRFNGQWFKVLAAGTFGNDTGDPSGAVTIKLYAVTGSLTAPAYTTLATTGALTPSALGVVNNWALSVKLYGDNASGILGGYYRAYQNGALVNSTPKKIETVISGLDFLNGLPHLQQGAVFGLTVGVTFGTSDQSNQASLYEFKATYPPVD